MKMPWTATSVALLLPMFTPLIVAQLKRLEPQTNTFNSTFSLTEEQIASLNLSDVAANNINIAVRFEQTNWATGSVLSDPFYTDLPEETRNASAGSVLKVEEFTETSAYTIAPSLALSRIVYQWKTLNGTLVPVSAFILWPYLPRGGGSAAPLVSWGHGTSGIVAECAPSHIRNLWFHFSGPYVLALAGYAVVATDYAGLGVSHYPDGVPIAHQYVSSPAAGNDLLYAAQAAQAAFPDKVSDEFVVMGHSQGGGAAWAAAQQQVELKIPGYVGAIAGSPVTDAVEMAKVIPGASISLLQVAISIVTLFPDLPLSEILTDAGIAALNLLKEVQGCNSVFSTLLASLLTSETPPLLVKEEFLQSYWAQSWSNFSSAGRKEYEGPLLVLQGTRDNVTPDVAVSLAVNRTCEEQPGQHLEYVIANGVDHVPIMYATQQIWLDWLDARFAAKNTSCSRKCSFRTIGSNAPRPVDQYQGDINYFLGIAMDAYQRA
ncbi:secretory lipase [Paramyrothecium foliicola]|nr:secretory lipase [Paramyrothecium foliicola]